MSLKWFLSSVLFLSCTVGDAMAAHLALRSLSATAGQEADESPVAVYRVLGAGFGGANGLYVCNKGRAVDTSTSQHKRPAEAERRQADGRCAYIQMAAQEQELAATLLAAGENHNHGAQPK